MSNAGTLGKRNWRTEGGDALVGPSSSQILWNGGVDIDLGDGPSDDYPVPRFMTCNVTGILNCIGHHANDVSVLRAVVAGQTIPFRPKQLIASGTTAQVILEY